MFAKVSQLLIFIRTIDEEFRINEELLQTIPLHGTTKGSDIYNSLVSVVNGYGGFEKCSSVVTDGASAMVGRKTGLVGLLKSNGVNCPTFHSLCPLERHFTNIPRNVVKLLTFNGDRG